VDPNILIKRYPLSW